MPESQAHRDIKDAADKWLKFEWGCLTIQEPVINKMWGLPMRPDVFGVCMSHPESRELGLTHDVEAEPSLAGIAAEYKKGHRADQFKSISDYQWLMYPAGLEPDLETLRVPVWVGLLELRTNGVVDVERRADRIQNHSKYLDRMKTLLLASQIQNLQRDTGRTAGEARRGKSRGSRLSDDEYTRLVKHLEEFPSDTMRGVSRDLEIDLKKLRKAALDGIPGVEYDTRWKTLDLQEAATASK